MKTELQTIETSELASVTGGDLFDNIDRGASHLSSKWRTNVNTTVGGPLGELFGAGAWVLGRFVGGVGGATHTIGLNNQP